MRPALLCMTLFCAGCLPEPPQETPSTPMSPSNTRPSGDPAASQDSATEAPSDTADYPTLASTGLTAPTTPCLPLHGMVSSATRWTFAWTAPDRVGTRRAMVHALDEQDQTATILTHETWTTPSGGQAFSGESFEQIACNDDGLFLLARRDAYQSTTDGQTASETEITTFDPPLLLMPNEPSLHTSWVSIASSTTTYASDTPDRTESIEQTHRITADDVFFPQVDRGTGFGAMALEVSPSDEGPYYWAPGIGIVSTPDLWHLTEYTEGD